MLPYTIGNYLAPMLNKPTPGVDHPEFKAAEAEARNRYQRYLDIQGTRSPDWFHRELGKIMWDNCGMARSKESLEKALQEIPVLREEFYRELLYLGHAAALYAARSPAYTTPDVDAIGDKERAPRRVDRRDVVKIRPYGIGVFGGVLQPVQSEVVVILDADAEDHALLLRGIASFAGGCGFAVLYNSSTRTVLVVGVLALLGNELRRMASDAYAQGRDPLDDTTEAATRRAARGTP